MSNKPNNRAKQTTSKRVAEARGASSGGNGLLIGGAVAIVVVVALLVAVFVGRDSNTDVAAEDVVANAEPVSVTGEALPQYPDTGTDPAVGMQMPTLKGDDLQGQELTIGPSGNPTMLVYLAHWCPHCNDEVPVLVDWMAGGGGEGVEIRGIATGIDENKPHYPPTSWLEELGWTPPTLLDPTGTAAQASGLSSFPYFVFLDDKGNVTSRASGVLSVEQIEEHLARAEVGSEGGPGTVPEGGLSSPAEG
jgi:thiol-disulfide isomerase/thioredoxin